MFLVWINLGVGGQTIGKNALLYIWKKLLGSWKELKFTLSSHDCVNPTTDTHMGPILGGRVRGTAYY